MSKAQILRPTRLGLTLLVTFLAALIALVVAGGPDALARDGGDRGGKGSISKQGLELRNDMRKLWEDTSPGRGWPSSASPRTRPTPRRPSAASCRTRTTSATRSSRSTATLPARNYPASAGAHPHSRRPHRRGTGGRLRRSRDASGSLAGECRRDRRIPERRKPALVEAPRDEERKCCTSTSI